MKSRFKIKGLDCANCATELERGKEKIKEIESVSINFITQRMELEFEESQKEEIIQKVKKVIKKEEPEVTIEEI